MCREKHRSIVRLWLTCWLLYASAAPAAENQSVLVLYANNRLLPANIEFEAALRETLADSTELSAEFLDYPRFDGESYTRALTRFLREKYALRPPSVLVVGGKAALDFLLRHRAELFPRVPVIHAGVVRSFLESRLPLPADVVGVPIEFEDTSCAANDPTCERFVKLVFDIPNPEDGKRVRTLFWDNNVLNSAYGLNARSILLECMDPGADSTCTYGISATNVLLDSLEDTNSTAVISDAGKFARGVKLEYLVVYP